MRDMEGKVALVVGGTTGIGSAAVHRLAKAGAKVAFSGLEEDIGQAQERELREKGEAALFVHANVTVAVEVEGMVQKVVEAFGGLDILVNCAGVQRYGDVVETPESVWDEVLDTNLKGMFLTCKYAVPEMLKRGGGAIVNVASVQAYASQSSVVAYTASKGGILAMTRAMAVDHAHEHIRINAVCPASVDTPMLRWAAGLFKGEGTEDGMIQDWGNMHPIGRVARPDEIAELIAFLASDKASFITGGDYRIDGGMLAALGVRLPESDEA